MEAAVFIANVKSFENGARSDIPYLYLDTKGKVTTGTGLMYSNAEALILDNLGYTINASGKAATHEQIRKAFDAVKKCPWGLRPESYKDVKGNDVSANTGRLNAVFSARLLKAKSVAIKWFAGNVQNNDNYQSFDELPEGIQQALTDMAYNMGSNEAHIKGLARFKKFSRALHIGDFANAAEESYRPDVGSSRNQKIHDWIYQYSTEFFGLPFSNKIILP